MYFCICTRYLLKTGKILGRENRADPRRTLTYIHSMEGKINLGLNISTFYSTRTSNIDVVFTCTTACTRVHKIL